MNTLYLFLSFLPVTYQIYKDLFITLPGLKNATLKEKINRSVAVSPFIILYLGLRISALNIVNMMLAFLLKTPEAHPLIYFVVSITEFTLWKILETKKDFADALLVSKLIVFARIEVIILPITLLLLILLQKIVGEY